MEEKREFLCGVVEGFYGRPWSMEQRKVLFQWMEKWGLNTYLYGPKDDLKHRLLWREVYSQEEEAQLKTLVSESESRGLRFVYALSPGQDIVFSSSCDIGLLKRKLKQVADLGCQAFAILFDDIDHSLCQADSETFSSFAHAQVTVTNEIFRFLGEPSVFLFCPTEYCGSLCSPNVAKSPYLLTVGEDLLPGISVIWTGSKVISRELSADSLEEVQMVLQRPPLVWDNLHANDYDSRRVFLGPFKGRAPGLRKHLRGLLLNPNCEFEADYIPLHTLGAWHRAGHQKDAEGQYCPEEALSAALKDWMVELNQTLHPGRQDRPVELKPSVAKSKSKTAGSADNHPATRGSQLKSLLDATQGQGSPSEASTKPTLGTTPDRGGQDTGVALCSEEGDLIADRKTKSPSAEEDRQEGKDSKEESQEGGGKAKERPPSRNGIQVKTQGKVSCGSKTPLTESEVRLLTGLYYLPHEHGAPAQRLLQDLAWLKANSHCVSANGKKGQSQKAEEWRRRAEQFQAACEDIARLHCSVVNSVNRAFLYDLYPYVWDLRNTALVAKAFISWLDGRVLNDGCPAGSWRNCFHWCGTTMGAELLGVESEPWMFKGGLAGEVQMLLPVGTNSELFSHPPPLFPTSRLYNIRPFQLKDKVELYRMVRQLHMKTLGIPDAALTHPDLMGDRFLGAFLALCPEYSFVLEDELGVCGCALGILDVRSFAKRCQATWLPSMRDKYPSRTHGVAAPQEVLLLYQDEQSDYPDSLLYHFPSQLCLDALPELVDCSVTRSLLTVLFSALKANGSQGVFCEVLPTDHTRLEFLTKLGFLEILRGEARPREGLVLGRLL
ncbi:protein O-GlcNAcase [Paramormyrops kingsleyae]|uniref:protein O-GlcNAcase n=1 Tax=Paramormyrops kingsleyae TaxID=1676925 RepID=A0A3B3QI12_9TELE|nr:protein O-GlcNAcase-like [Paramormyrops kingsleyae]